MQLLSPCGSGQRGREGFFNRALLARAISEYFIFILKSLMWLSPSHCRRRLAYCGHRCRRITAAGPSMRQALSGLPRWNVRCDDKWATRTATARWACAGVLLFIKNRYYQPICKPCVDSHQGAARRSSPATAPPWPPRLCCRKRNRVDADLDQPARRRRFPLRRFGQQNELFLRHFHRLSVTPAYGTFPSWRTPHWLMMNESYK